MIDRATALAELRRIFSYDLEYGLDEAEKASSDPITHLTPEGDSCLHLAALRGDARAIALLLDLGAEIDQRGDMGSTALHYAAISRNWESFQLLLDRGADPNIINKIGARSGEFPCTPKSE